MPGGVEVKSIHIGAAHFSNASPVTGRLGSHDVEIVTSTSEAKLHASPAAPLKKQGALAKFLEKADLCFLNVSDRLIPDRLIGIKNKRQPEVVSTILPTPPRRSELEILESLARGVKANVERGFQKIINNRAVQNLKLIEDWKEFNNFDFIRDAHKQIPVFDGRLENVCVTLRGLINSSDPKLRLQAKEMLDWRIGEIPLSEWIESNKSVSTWLASAKLPELSAAADKLNEWVQMAGKLRDKIVLMMPAKPVPKNSTSEIYTPPKPEEIVPDQMGRKIAALFLEPASNWKPVSGKEIKSLLTSKDTGLHRIIAGMSVIYKCGSADFRNAALESLQTKVGGIPLIEWGRKEGSVNKWLNATRPDERASAAEDINTWVENAKHLRALLNDESQYQAGIETGDDQFIGDGEAVDKTKEIVLDSVSALHSKVSPNLKVTLSESKANKFKNLIGSGSLNSKYIKESAKTLGDLMIILEMVFPLKAPDNPTVKSPGTVTGNSAPTPTETDIVLPDEDFPSWNIVSSLKDKSTHPKLLQVTGDSAPTPTETDIVLPDEDFPSWNIVNKPTHPKPLQASEGDTSNSATAKISEKDAAFIERARKTLSKATDWKELKEKDINLLVKSGVFESRSAPLNRRFDLLKKNGGGLNNIVGSIIIFSKFGTNTEKDLALSMLNKSIGGITVQAWGTKDEDTLASQIKTLKSDGRRKMALDLNELIAGAKRLISGDEKSIIGAGLPPIKPDTNTPLN